MIVSVVKCEAVQHQRLESHTDVNSALHTGHIVCTAIKYITRLSRLNILENLVIFYLLDNHKTLARNFHLAVTTPC